MLAERDLTNPTTRCAILALPESVLLTETISRLRRAGWRILRAATIDAVREFASRVGPDVVVLPADGPDESGWLTCAKLLCAVPRLRMIVVGEPTKDGIEFARFIGASLVRGDATAEELADHVENGALQPL